MKVHYKEPCSFLLLEDVDQGDWYLTFFTGGPVEIDFCVKLSDDEAKQALVSKEDTKKLVEFFKSHREIVANRRVIPSKKP